MRTGSFRCGLGSILLVFAIVLSMTLSMTFTANLVLADAVISYPGHPMQPQNIFDVSQGQTFTLRHSMAWDEEGVPGYYLVAIWWDYYDLANNAIGDNGRTFTLVSATAYFDNNGDNVADAGVALIDATVSTGDNGTRYTIGVSNAAGNDNDGTFNVDIVLRAAGPDGTPHKQSDNHPINYTIMQSLESVPPSLAVPLVTVVVSEWTGGVVVRGKANAYNVDGAGIMPFKDYVAGDNPPIIAAQKVDYGAVLVGGISSSSRNWRWNDTSPLNPDPHLDNLLDAAFQWMVPNAANVLWWDHPDVYNDTGMCSQLVAALEALGYTVIGDERELADMYTGYIHSFSGTITENLMATDDSYVIENKPTQRGDASFNGTSYNMCVGANTAAGEEDTRVFVQFDLTGLSSPTAISSATFMLETSAYPQDNIQLGAYEAGDGWDELTLCWDNMPATGSNLGYQDVWTDERYVWPSWDVTSYVQAEFASDNIVSIMIKSENEPLYAGVRVAARESYSGAYAPRLEITYTGTIHEVYDYGLENADIFVINQLQRGTGSWGGDSGLMTATELSIIDSWVRGGGGLMITDGGDYGGYNFCRVGNKILDTLGVNWWLQHDQIYDPVDNWGAWYGIVTDVDVSTPIGMMYEANTTGSPGKTTVGLYSTCSLVAKPVGPPPLFVSVAPALQTQLANTLLTYTVAVGNTGPIADRFLLSVSDDQGWGPTISPSYLDIASGGIDTATVNVTIPIGTPYCTYDTITVTATSLADNTVSNSGTAQAHSLGWWPILRDVTVDIEPDHQEAELVIDRDAVKKRYDPLTFKVIVTNTGLLWDKYIITASTNSDKILELWPTELFLQPGQSDFVVLSVTVPEDEVGSTLNYILVEAVGTFATGTGEDIGNAAAFDMCTVHVAEARCVRLDVLPFQVQSATPGSKVRWVARVKNLGNVLNTYLVEVTNVVSDANRVYDPAVVTVTPEGPITLPPCNWEQVTIDLDVPEDLEMSTRIYVTVTVTSLDDPECTDTAEVEVHVVRGIPPIPQGVIKLEIETELLAIQVWPTYWDFGVLDEAESATSGIFTVRNIGNTPVDVTIAGNDAYSSPGELTTTWLLDDLGNVGLDRYAMWYGLPPNVVLTKVPTPLMSSLVPSEERPFDLKIQAPSSITVPSRMWTIVTLTAVES